MNVASVGLKIESVGGTVLGGCWNIVSSVCSASGSGSMNGGPGGNTGFIPAEGLFKPLAFGPVPAVGVGNSCVRSSAPPTSNSPSALNSTLKNFAGGSLEVLSMRSRTIELTSFSSLSVPAL